VESFLKGLEGGRLLRPPQARVRRTGGARCGGEYEYTTESAWTRLVADLIHFANGAYDGRLVSGDDDFVPAVEAVNALGKQVWVATLSPDELSSDLRVRCFGHIDLREVAPSRRPPARSPSAPGLVRGGGGPPREVRRGVILALDQALQRARPSAAARRRACPTSAGATS
jgi:hypothetical protein